MSGSPFESPGFDRGALDANNFLSQLAPQTRSHEAGQDPFLSGPAHSADFSRGIRLTMGKIVASLPYVNWYLVQLDDARGKKPGFKCLPDTAPHPLGVGETSPWPPNTKVLCFEHPGSSSVGIITAIPQALTDSNLTNSDWISQGSNTGFRKERYYWDLLFKLQRQGGIQDYSDNSPNDATAVGEWGRMAETGVGIFVDSFMSYLRASEVTGFYAFYHDQLARMAGHNLDIRSAGHEVTARDDQGEFQYSHGDTPFIWEGMGAFAKEETVHREVDDHSVLFHPTGAKYEPKHNDQQPFYRYREYGGYLGQGRMREVVLPPKESGVQRLSDRDAISGVFREHIGLTGHVSWQTAKGFDLVKRVMIPAAKQIKLPEDASEGDGDNDTNYKAAGAYGSGAEHVLRDFAGGADLPHVANIAGIADRHAVECNWYSVHPFVYHQKDYFVPEQQQLARLSRLQQPLTFGALESGNWLDRPAAKKLHVDHRWGDVDYYENTAGISVTDDGGVCIFDGYGGEIRLVGGNIQISCPGNVFLQPGKSLIGLAGDDACIRAQKSAELTAGNKDLRLYARNNLQVLAQHGAVLLESRYDPQNLEGDDPNPMHKAFGFDGATGEDVESGGVIFKSARSPIVTWSKGIYLRTGSQKGGKPKPGEVMPGEIVLDADKGQQPIRTVSSRFDRQINESCSDYFGIDAVRSTNYFSERAAQFGSALVALDQFMAVGQSQFGGNVAVANGHIATEFADQASYFVAPLKDKALDAVTANLQQAIDRGQTFNNQGDKAYERFTKDFYDEDMPGNEDVQKQTGFSYRTTEQYNADGLKLPQTRWQQMATVMGGARAWKEKPVTYQESDGYPYPGVELESATFVPRYFNWGTGRDITRGDGAMYAAPQMGSLGGGPYLTITEEIQ